MREQLGAILAPVVGQGLDPSGDPNVALDPVWTRKLPVDGVADERVDEGVLRGSEDCRPPVAPEELLAPERAQDPVDRLVVLLRDEPEAVRPHDAAHHRGVAEQLLLSRWEEVDPSGHDPEHAVGEPLDVPAGGVHAHELLRVERIARRLCHDRFAEACVGRIAAQERLDEVCGLGGRQRAERHGQRVPLAATPLRPALEQLRARAADHEQRRALDEVDEGVDEVEQPVVGPLEVVEDEHERPPLRERLEEDAPAGEELRVTFAEADVLGHEPDERLEARSDPASLRLAYQLLHGVRELRRSRARVIVLVDSRLRLDDLAERPERDAVAVRQAPAVPPGDDLLVLLAPCARAPRRACSCRSPGTPTSVTSCGERSTRTRANAPSSSARSWSRPTSGVDGSPPRSPTRPSTSTASHTSIGSLLPFASTAR